MLNTYYIDSDNCLSVETDLTLDPNVQTAEGTLRPRGPGHHDEGLGRQPHWSKVWNSFAGAPPSAT